MTIFLYWYNNHKGTLKAESLYSAKQEVIKLHKVPKSKQGLITVMSEKSYKNEDFRFN